jgi:hypothetical protein
MDDKEELRLQFALLTVNKLKHNQDALMYNSTTLVDSCVGRLSRYIMNV